MIANTDPTGQRRDLEMRSKGLSCRGKIESKQWSFFRRKL